MIETIRDGQPTTAFMANGDRVSIEMRDEHGQSVFGTIDQQVVIRG
jgi:fumarylacetoacetate (FAA) hydrolase